MIKEASAVIALVGTIGSGVFVVDSRYEQIKNVDSVRTEVAQLEQKLELSSVNEELHMIQSRKWELEDRAKKRPDDEDLVRDLRELEQRQIELKSEKELILKNLDSSN